MIPLWEFNIIVVKISWINLIHILTNNIILDVRIAIFTMKVSVLGKVILAAI